MTLENWLTNMIKHSAQEEAWARQAVEGLAVARSLFPASKIQWLECEVLDSHSEKPSSEFVSCFKVVPGDKSEPCHKAQSSSLTFPETFLSGNS